MQTKTCTRCYQNIALTQFQIRRASKDGLTSACKPCLSEYDKSRAKKPDRVQMRLDYQKTMSGILAVGRAKKAWKARNPVKSKAAEIVGNAVRDGKLLKSKICEQCNVSGIIHGHHDDYAKPLEVRWLCPACHSAWHKENGEALNG